MDVSKVMELVEIHRSNPFELEKIKRTVEDLFERGKIELRPVLEKINEYLRKAEIAEKEFLSKIREHQEKELKRFIEGEHTKVKEIRPTGLAGKIEIELDRLAPAIYTLKDVIEYRLEKGIKIPVTLKYDLDRIINTLENYLKMLKDIRGVL